jgi:hypothetical protein
MKDRIILSEQASGYLDIVKRRLLLSGQDDYIPLRIAFGRSLQTKAEPKYPDNPDVSNKTSKRKSLQLTTFEQSQGILFKALVSQLYKRRVEGDQYVDLLTAHIEHGLWLIATETEKISGYDYIAMIANVLNVREGTGLVKEHAIISPKVLQVKIGVDKINQQPVEYQINIAQNPHFAIIGGSGAGKTYFLKYLLKEIRQATNFKTNFIIFDYKDGDIAKDEPFLKATQAMVLNARNTPLPLNIFAGAQYDEKEQKSRAERIVEIVKNVEANIGKVQEENLYRAIVNAYQNHSPYPDFEAIRDELTEINSKPDSLTSVLRPLVEQNYFASKEKHIYDSWLNQTLVIDIHQIERKDLVCFFVLNQIYQELKNLGQAPVDSATKARQIRIVVVIDEAHYFLENPKRAKILARMIREVRSSGGAVILASQSPDDYDQADFDFLEQIEFPIILKSNPKSHKFLEQKFGVSSQKAKELLLEVSKLNRGEAYVLSNKKPVIVELTK